MDDLTHYMEATGRLSRENDRLRFLLGLAEAHVSRGSSLRTDIREALRFRCELARDEAADATQPTEEVTMEAATAVTYPRQDGDFTVIGPECFASQDGSLLCWKGENYVRQATEGTTMDAARKDEIITDVTLREGEQAVAVDGGVLIRDHHAARMAMTPEEIQATRPATGAISEALLYLRSDPEACRITNVSKAVEVLARAENPPSEVGSYGGTGDSGFAQ